jgi:hypothetical protein
MQFQAGRSGNPKGKAKGTRHRTTMAAQVLLDGQAEALTQKAVELALSGDTVALRLCLDRVLPLRKGSPVRFAMPALDTPADLVAALGSVAKAVGNGALTPDEAAAIASLLNSQTQAIELVQFKAELEELRKKVVG